MNDFLPLGFNETNKDSLGPVYFFKHGEVMVTWSKDYRDKVYRFSTHKGIRTFTTPIGKTYDTFNVVDRMENPFDSSMNDFKNKILKTLDNWLKTI